ncbi:MAG: redoxin domain-containing protein, partial [Bacteroidetes bacterium]|nr:redoxin domain-containing protein [Bacteroidota bacterium]
VNDISLERERLLLQFIKKYPSSLVSWEQVKGRSYGIEPETLEPEFQALSPKFRNSKEGKEILERLNIAKVIHIGSIAPAFTQNDIAGNPVSLASLKGKYVLIDFWASWCGICRLENPNILKAYDAFKDKGFTVLGVSLDDSAHKDKWIEAVHHDKMPWQQVSDLRGSRLNEVAVLYGIRGIPQNVLIDPKGVVVAKNLRDKDLMEKLEEIFGHSYVMANVAGMKDTAAIFYYYKGDTYCRDTVMIKNGSFSWNADITEPQKIIATCRPTPTHFIQFYAENSSIHINGNVDDLKKVKITGSALQDEADALELSMRDIMAPLDSIADRFFKSGEEERKTMLEPMRALGDQRRARVKQYIKDHPDSWLSLNLVNEMSSGEYGEVAQLYNGLSEKSRQTAMAKRIEATMDVTKRKAMGTALLNFSQADSSGKTVSLADFKGKYVLVDFWASWCGPCRAENPNVLKAYNAFKDKSFTVVGISLDDNADKWKKAIRDDHMPWTQLSDLKGWKNEMATYYGIHAIPDNFLIDPQGKIIAKGLRSDELLKKLASLLN